MDLGDREEDSTIDFKFSTRNVSAAPATLAGTPVLSVYISNNTTQSTAGITLTVDFDSLTGLNHVNIDTSADAFYATANDYEVVITTGTVNSVSVIGTTIATFSIENRVTGAAGAGDWTVSERNEIRGRLGVTGTTAAGGNTPTLTLQTTSDAILLDTAEIGAAGAGLTNINLPNQTMDITGNLSGSVGSVTGAVGSVTGAVGSVTGNVGGNVVGSVASVTAIDTTAGAIDNVVLVATTTTNTDQRGTDSALLAADINLTAGAVDNVTLVATTTTNTDMRGTDSALLAADINLTAGAVDNVTLVATTTTNTDMRGTDSAATAAQVNAEVLDVMTVDTFAEPTSVPLATASIEEKISWLMALSRNKLTQTATTQSLRNDAQTGDIATATVSDDGTIFTRDEFS